MIRGKPGSSTILPNWLASIVKIAFIIFGILMIATAISVGGFIYSGADRATLFLWATVVAIIIVVGWAIVSAGNAIRSQHESRYVPPQVQKADVPPPVDVYRVGEIPQELRRERERRP